MAFTCLICNIRWEEPSQALLAMLTNSNLVEDPGRDRDILGDALVGRVVETPFDGSHFQIHRGPIRGSQVSEEYVWRRECVHRMEPSELQWEMKARVSLCTLVSSRSSPCP